MPTFTKYHSCPVFTYILTYIISFSLSSFPLKTLLLFPVLTQGEVLESSKVTQPTVTKLGLNVMSIVLQKSYKIVGMIVSPPENGAVIDHEPIPRPTMDVLGGSSPILENTMYTVLAYTVLKVSTLYISFSVLHSR